MTTTTIYTEIPTGPCSAGAVAIGAVTFGALPGAYLFACEYAGRKARQKFYKELNKAANNNICLSFKIGILDVALLIYNPLAGIWKKMFSGAYANGSGVCKKGWKR